MAGAVAAAAYVSEAWAWDVAASSGVGRHAVTTTTAIRAQEMKTPRMHVSAQITCLRTEHGSLTGERVTRSLSTSTLVNSYADAGTDRRPAGRQGDDSSC